MGRLLAGNLRSGRILVRNLPAKSIDVNPVLNASGTIKATLQLPLVDPNTDIAIDLRNTIIPTKSFIAYQEGDRVWAGPLWVEDYDMDSRVLTWNATADIRSLWAYRFVLPALADGDTAAGHDSAYGPLSLRTIAKRLVEQAQSWVAGDVPLDLEADFAGTAVRNDYLGIDLHRLDEKLAQITGVQDGPDMRFPARITEDGQHVRWSMVTGDPLLGAGVEHRWDMTVPGRSVKGTKINRDGRSILTDEFEQGGTLEDGTVLEARSVDHTLTAGDEGYPLMQGSTDRSSVTSPGVLQGHADAATAKGRYHTETWSFSTKKDVAPTLADVTEGDYGTLVFDDPWLGKDERRLRILALAIKEGDDFMQVTCAPTRSEA